MIDKNIKVWQVQLFIQAPYKAETKSWCNVISEHTYS